MAHVLIVEDEADSRSALGELVAQCGYSVAAAGSLREARIHLARQDPDLVLADLHLPDGKGLELLDELRSRSAAELVLITGQASVESAVSALRGGAADYLVKPVDVARLEAILSRLTRARDGDAAPPSIEREEGWFGPLLGKSPAMLTLYAQIQRVAPTESTVLLVGESGTGKELVAQTLHDLSRRWRHSYLVVNCGAISPNLIESEMFGHERGSFTGADRQHRGYFERSDHGTLLLDEITEMPVELQVKLLRVLETGRFMRIGTTRELESDVRVIAATNRDPQEALAAGLMRPDLYHRLNVFPIRIPPLRERSGDVELLAQHFLNLFNRERGGKKVFAPDAMNELAARPWSGNVRELRNFIQRAYILADDVVDPAALLAVTEGGGSAAAPTIRIPIGITLAEMDRRLILATLERYAGAKKHSAEILGISLKTLYNRLEEYRVRDHAQASRKAAAD